MKSGLFTSPVHQQDAGGAKMARWVPAMPCQSSPVKRSIIALLPPGAPGFAARPVRPEEPVAAPGRASKLRASTARTGPDRLVGSSEAVLECRGLGAARSGRLRYGPGSGGSGGAGPGAAGWAGVLPVAVVACAVVPARGPPGGRRPLKLLVAGSGQ